MTMRLVSFAMVLALASIAHADDKAPSFELLDRGDAVEVIAHNVKAARTAILPVRSRLEIPIVAGPLARRLVPGDATVKLVELDSDNQQQMLSVKLGFERLDVKTLARFAQAIQVGEDLHVIVPRKVPVDGVAPRLPEPTNMPVAAKLEAAKPEPAKPAETAKLPEPPKPSKPEARPATDARPVADVAPIAPPVLGPPQPDPKPEAKPEAKIPTRPDARPAAKPHAATSEPLHQALASEPGDAWSKIALYGALGLAAAGAGVWLLRKKQAQQPQSSTIEVIAQRSLGGKARVVWLSAGQREMIVSITPQQIRMLDQWCKPDAPAVAADEPPAAPSDVDGHDLRDALIHKLDKLHEKVAEAPRRQTSTLEAQRRPTGAFAAQRQTGAMPAQRPPTGAAPPPPPRRQTGSLPVQPAPDRPLESALSPAVSGILRLRGRTGQMPAVSADVATGDVEADELWAKEILAATGARR